MMVPRKSGLIVNISSPGGLVYVFNVAYGIGKAACDRMAQDCGIELRSSNVTMISLWPGPVQTETIAIAKDRKDLFRATASFAGSRFCAEKVPHKII
jgi:NAD(P)-dependent dehydrogenase (short-subunit alcohol dehydrogenase family)